MTLTQRTNYLHLAKSMHHFIRQRTKGTGVDLLLMNLEMN
jgi:hypothetical protein